MLLYRLYCAILLFVIYCGSLFRIHFIQRFVITLAFIGGWSLLCEFVFCGCVMLLELLLRVAFAVYLGLLIAVLLLCWDLLFEFDFVCLRTLVYLFDILAPFIFDYYFGL